MDRGNMMGADKIERKGDSSMRDGSDEAMEMKGCCGAEER